MYHSLFCLILSVYDSLLWFFGCGDLHQFQVHLVIVEFLGPLDIFILVFGLAADCLQLAGFLGCFGEDAVDLVYVADVVAAPQLVVVRADVGGINLHDIIIISLSM